ncbi:putative PRS2 protein [Psychrobacter sp. JCM 18900]|nr:putative PRS2 protein [Psychrobacter sp. JCM 18900]
MPTIFVSLLGMGMSLSVWFTLVLSALVLLFYMRLSTPLFLAMGMFILICLSVMAAMHGALKRGQRYLSLLGLASSLVIKSKAKKPSFFKDLQFLLIGPAWVANSLMQRK